MHLTQGNLCISERFLLFLCKICTLEHGNKAKLERRHVLLRCKLTFKIFRLDLIPVQTDFHNFRAWPYCGANRFGLIVVHQSGNYLTNLTFSKGAKFYRCLFEAFIKSLLQKGFCNCLIKCCFKCGSF